MIKVELRRGEERRQAVKKAVDALGPEFIKLIKNAEYILIKPDLTHPELQLASTHVDAVRGVLDVLRLYVDVPIIIADAGRGGTAAAFRNLGFLDLQREYKNINLCDLQRDETVETVIKYGLSEVMLARRSKIAIEAPCIISVSPMKTHNLLTAALGVVNLAMGTWIVPERQTESGILANREPFLQAGGEAMAHEVIAGLFAAHPSSVSVIDGILAMEGAGPIHGTPVHLGVVLAGLDPIAVDTVAATLMGLDAHSLFYLEECAKKGLGSNEISEIDIPLLDLQELSRSFVIKT